MRRFLSTILATLALALVVSQASASEQKALGKGKKIKPVTSVKVTVNDCDDKCTTYGTEVKFFSTPTAAAKEALKGEKLVLVLHVSGHFEDPRFT